MFKRNSPRMVSRCSDANNGIWPNDGERLASLRKQLADPTQNHPVDDRKLHPTGPASSQHDHLLPQHRDLGFQRRARSEQIDDNPKNYSAEIQHPAEDRPILRLTPTGWNRPAPCVVRQKDDGIRIDRRLRNVFQDGLTAECATGFGADNQRVCLDLPSRRIA